jgi:ABC-type nitrate/sulfonate/bicarbonate transport system substrate-binding protein
LHGTLPPNAYGELGARAEAFGFEDVTLHDLLMRRPVWPVLCDIARATNRVKVGPNVTHPFLTRKDDGIETPADMAGRVRGTSAIGGSTHFLGRAMLAEHGLEEEVDYDLVEVTFALGQEALETGQVDMMELASFFGIRALATDQFDVLFCVTDVQDPFVQLLQGFRRDFVEENPEVVRRFVEDWATVTNWVLDPANRDQVIQATHQATDMPVDLLDSFLLIEGQDYHRPRNGALDIDALQANWDFFHEIGEIPALNVRDHIIPEFMPPES